MGPRERIFTANLSKVTYCMGEFLLTLVAYFERDWVYLQLWLAIPGALTLLYWVYVFLFALLMSTSVRIIHEIPVDIPGNQCITITHFRHVVCMVCKCMSSYVQVYDRYSSWNIYVVDMLSLMYCNCDVLVDQGWSQNPPVGWCHVAESVRPRRL